MVRRGFCIKHFLYLLFRAARDGIFLKFLYLSYVRTLATRFSPTENFAHISFFSIFAAAAAAAGAPNRRKPTRRPPNGRGARRSGGGRKN